MTEIKLHNSSGITTSITSYGGRIMSLHVPDSSGRSADIVLGYSQTKSYYTSNEKFFGATIGRYGNRIADAKFSLGNNIYILEQNNGINCLHGGTMGFHNVEWQLKKKDNRSVEMTYHSPDGEAGFPGNLDVRVIYSLTDNNELNIEYFARTDKPTVVNLTHHSFFNLTGDPLKTINDHLMQIFADSFTPVDNGLIPTGEIAGVQGTPFDFRQPVAIGSRLEIDNQQLKYGKGYDHNWVLTLNPSKKAIRMAAKVAEPVSGRIMEVFTNEPGIQFYGGNFLNGSDTGKNNIPYHFRTAFCLETQHFPDSPNKPSFPSTLLMPGDEYYSTCIYRFKTES